MAENEKNMNNGERQQTLNALRARRDNAEMNITAKEAILESNKSLLEGAQEEQERAESNVRAAEEALRNAKAVLKEAKRKTFDRNKAVVETENDLTKWRRCKELIDEDIAQHQTIYLIAPGYKGNMPKFGRMISVMAFEEMAVEVDEQIGELIHEPTRAEMRNSGFDDNNEMFTAYDYASLVVKYTKSDEPVKVLVDDERIKRILEGQGLEV